MSKELLQAIIDEGVSKESLNSFFNSISNNYSEKETSLSPPKDPRFNHLEMLGEIIFSPSQKLVVVIANVSENLSERSSKKAQYEAAKRVLRDLLKYDAGIFVFYDNKRRFRFSFVYTQYAGTTINFSNFRRFTYFVDPDQTNKTFKDRLGLCSFTDLDALKDAFSVEKVNKEFYEKIASYYYKLTGKEGKPRQLTLPSVAASNDIKYEEFAVRLIGRVVFCWFLKHKTSPAGIPLIPSGILSSGAIVQKNDYYHLILEKLFFEVMNKPTINRHANISLFLPDHQKIPFLNGGLFEPNEDDFYNDGLNGGLKIPNEWFVDFFGLLEQYNFTIDENSLVDAEVSVDPEMMGRIFENLLAEVNPDTGETARKATGSYYTPRVIVDYMVGQSLKQFLLSKTPLNESQIIDLLDYEKDIKDWGDEAKAAVVKALGKITIIDPACGSGAFPMGVLQRMIHALEKVDPELRLWRQQYMDTLDSAFRDTVTESVSRENWDYLRKLIIVRESIYGVDIQEIAVEIAKLRCFLSLVVDEFVTDEPNKNRGIKPLPNLEFKFVAANSLIGLPPTADLGILEDHDSIQELSKLRNEYFTSYGKQKDKIKMEFAEVQGRMLEHHLKHASIIKTDFTGLSRKQENVVDTQTKLLSTWRPFSNGSSPWFDPVWMFGTKGFDVVIANPPYIDSEGMVNAGQGDLRETISRTYKMTKGNWDIYIAFFEFGFNLLNDDGVLTFITPDKWISKPFGDELRKGTIQKLFAILKAGRDIFDSSNVDSIITFFTNNQMKQIVISEIKNNTFTFKREVDKKLLKSPFALDYLFSNHIEILLKLDTNPSRISNLGYCENACATSDAYKLADLIKEGEKPFEPTNHLKIVNTGTIGKYSPKWGVREMTYLGQKYLHPIVNKKDFLSSFKNSYSAKALRPKLIIKGLNLLDACIDLEGHIIPGKTTLMVTSDRQDRLYLLLSILNCKLALFYMKERYPASSYNQGTTFTTDMINNFPVPEIKEEDKTSLIKAASEILLITNGSDYALNNDEQAKVKELQRQIDQLVYQLYGLTPEEIAVVEGGAK